jgi:hypothetical protein
MTVRNLEHALRPRSVAVIGASDEPGSVGHTLTQNVLTGGFEGQVYLVNPHHGTIAGRDFFKSVEALPEAPELSVVCFRHLPAGRPGAVASSPAAAELDAHQDRLQRDLEASGEGWLTTTRLRGATYLRAGILNTQSTTRDVDELLELLRRLARDA